MANKTIGLFVQAYDKYSIEQEYNEYIFDRSKNKNIEINSESLIEV